MSQPSHRAKSAPPAVSDAAARYAAELVERASDIRLDRLFGTLDRTRGERALYRSRARRHIQVVAIATDALTDDELLAVMRYRLAQYVAVHFVDLERIHRERIEHEPLGHTSGHDVHLIAGDTRSGEILCYMTLKQLKGAPPGATFRTRERPLFPVEEVHGWGVFNRLRILPDMPVERVRELGRFVKNQRYPALDERSVRAPLETSLALWRILEHELRPDVDAFVGDFEEGIAQARLAYFHVPMAVLHGTVPYESETAWLYRRYRHRTVFPFAVLLDDLPDVRARKKAIDLALSLPGKLALLRLAQLRGKTGTKRSSLEPPGGLPAIDEMLVLSQPDVEMHERLRIIESGVQLRSAPLFADLSVAEAAVLGTLLERVALQAGQVVLRQGDEGDALFVIESGELEVRREGEALARLGPGDHFGEIALVTGGRRVADVVAVSDATILRLGRDVYLSYLSELPDVSGKTEATAGARSADAERRSADSAAALLPGITTEEAAVLGAHMRRVTAGAGDTIVRQGDVGDALYLIVAGQADVVVHGADGGQRTVATLGVGEFFGEIALVVGAPRIADVVARSPMTLMRLDSAGFEAFCGYAARTGSSVAATAARRAAETARRFEARR